MYLEMGQLDWKIGMGGKGQGGTEPGLRTKAEPVCPSHMEQGLSDWGSDPGPQNPSFAR